MSRYYRIEIGGDTPAVYTSLVNGINDPGAPLVEMDIMTSVCSIPTGNSFVRVWGVSLQTISQAFDFNFAPIKVYGGMSKGLPLAKPSQAGLLCEGQIIQAYGNWIDVQNQSLDLNIIVDDRTNKNIVWNWKAGTSMADALRSSLQTAFPDRTISITIDSRLVLSADEASFYTNITQFGAYIKYLSGSIIGGDYQGVQILLREREVIVFDGSTQATPTQIEFTDLIGQPTWIGPGQVQFNTVMRADIGVGSYIRFPPTTYITTPGSRSQYRDKSAFQGVFLISDMARHVGNSRQPDGVSWISTFNCVAL